MANGADSKELRRLADKLESLQKDNKADEGDSVTAELVYDKDFKDFTPQGTKRLKRVWRIGQNQRGNGMGKHEEEGN